MAEHHDESERDSSSKTEEPSERRREEFAQRGQNAVSPNLVTAIAFLGAAATMAVFLPRASAAVLAFSARVWASGSVEPTDLLRRVAGDGSAVFAWVLLPIAGGALLGGIAASLAQGAGGFRPELALPNPNRIDPMAGFIRLFSKKAAIDTGANLLRFAVVAAVAWKSMVEAIEVFSQGHATTAEASRSIGRAMWTVTLRAGTALVVLGVLDHLMKRRELMENLRMTREEAIRERKQEEGDPGMRHRRREMMRKMLRKKPPAQAMKLATFVVTNPTHFAVALQYKPGVTRAPKVVAKGAGALALAIRRAAKEAGVPLVENPPLARALFRSVPVGGEIPPALYEAVARILAYLYRISRGLPASLPPAGP